MPDATIADLDPVPAPMTGAELVEIERGGVSFRTTTGALAVAPPSPLAIVSSGISQDLDPLGGLYYVTSGGSADVELLNLPNIAGGENAKNIGRMLIVTFVAQTDENDTLKISVNGSGNVYYWNPTPTLPGAILTYAGVVLQNIGETAVFLWIGNSWRFAPQYSNFNDGTTPNTFTATYTGGPDIVVTGAPGGDAAITGGANAYANGGDARLQGGENAAGANAGGEALVAGGDSQEGNGGNLTLRAGLAAGAGADGHILITGLPTADPVLAGVLWSDAGVLKVSAG